MTRLSEGSASLVTGELLDEVASAVHLREGVAGVRTFVRELSRREPISVRDLARAVGLPLPIVSAISSELRSRGVVSDRRPLQLTGPARDELAGAAGPDVGVCPRCGGRGHVIPDDLWPVVDRQASAEAASPSVRVELDQAHCTPETAVRRALLLADQGALEGRRVLLLGDDDLLSIAIVAVADHLGLPGPAELVALDVDAELVEFLNKSNGVVDARVRDLREPLPDDLMGRFDVVVTDPPYTAAGAALFGSRAASALVPRPGGELFFSFGSTHPDVVGSAQRELLAMGFAIGSVIPDFNDYIGTGALAGSSTMYHLVSTGPLRPTIPGRYDGDLYTGEHQERPRRYVCRSCGRDHLVGRGRQVETIAALQELGCQCGAGVFEPGERADSD